MKGTKEHSLKKLPARVLGAVAIVVLVIGAVVFAAWILLAQPTWRSNHASTARVSPEKLREHVEALSERFSPRDWRHANNLEQCADYIARCFAAAGAAVESQPVMVHGRQYRNVIGRFGVGGQPRVVVGAHYDTCGEQPGADDNASGVAVLIELADLLGRRSPTRAVDVVAYVFEEPPFFRTANMGSAVHAKSIAADRALYRGVIVLEMVGFFADERGSQGYPVPLLRLLYPSRGNFIGVVSRWDQGDWIKAVKVGMKGTTDLPVYSIRAPAALPGIDFSDHMNYWPHGIRAVMVTDTSFYRNQDYHTPGDTAGRLDYNRMAQVAVGVLGAIESM